MFNVAKLQLLLGVHMSGKKAQNYLLVSWGGRRHIETQSKHATFWDLHYKSEHIHRS